MAQTTSTIIGNLTEEPVLHYFEKTDTYKARVRLASSRRVRDKEHTNTWNDVDPLYIHLEMWGPLALNVKKSLGRGMPVIAYGTLITDEWEDKEGKNQQRILLRCYSLGLDLNRYVIASQRIETAERNLIGAALPVDVDPTSLCDKVYLNKNGGSVGSPELGVGEGGAPADNEGAVPF